MSTVVPESAPGSDRRPLARFGPTAALLAPAFLVLAVGVVLVPFEGGYARTLWSPIALFLLALLVLVLVVAAPARSDRTRLVDVAIAAFGLFTLWNYLSILWADVPGDAWEGANRTALFFLAFTLVAMRPWPIRASTHALELVVTGLTLLAGGVLIATIGDDSSSLFIGGRLSEPIGYANALAAVWLIGFWPALHLTVTPERHWALRSLALFCATLLLTTSLLSQSRGSAVGFAVTVVVFLLLYPRRWLALAALAVPLATVVIGWDDLTRVRQVADSAALSDALSDARRTILAGAIISFALCGLVILLFRRVLGERGPNVQARRTGERAFLGLTGVAAVVGVVALAMSGGWLQDRWDSFRVIDYSGVEEGQSRFTGSLGSGRYDFYRVALDEFRSSPVIGIGGENFAVPYLADRKTSEAPRYVHSLPLSILSQLGLIGSLLFLTFLGAVLVAIARARASGSLTQQGLVIGALAGTVSWMAHGAVDWLWEYPALSLPALGLLAVAARTGEREPVPPARAGGRRSTPRAWPARALVAAGVVVLGLAIALPGAAARYEKQASDHGKQQPAAALKDYNRAASLDWLSADALISRAVLARRVGLRDQARVDLRDAIAREDRNWFAHLELGLLDAFEKRWGPAQRSLATAKALNPRQDVIGEVQALVRRRQRVDPDDVEAILAGQLSQRLQPFDAE